MLLVALLAQALQGETPTSSCSGGRVQTLCTHDANLIKHFFAREVQGVDQSQNQGSSSSIRAAMQQALPCRHTSSCSTRQRHHPRGVVVLDLTIMCLQCVIREKRAAAGMFGWVSSIWVVIAAAPAMHARLKPTYCIGRLET